MTHNAKVIHSFTFRCISDPILSLSWHWWDAFVFHGSCHITVL
jgi:hypothetical protein